MKKRHRTALILGVVLGILVAAGWGYYRYTYPYGRSHCCNKAIFYLLLEYAEDHDGRFPSSDQPGALGLAPLLEYSPGSFEYIVGKAGNLDLAREFYQKHGYLKTEHSSWHYVSGLTTTDDHKAILWDKIPLGHNGERTKRNTREVLMVSGSSRAIPEVEWDEFLKFQDAP